MTGGNSFGTSEHCSDNDDGGEGVLEWSGRGSGGDAVEEVRGRSGGEGAGYMEYCERRCGYLAAKSCL